MFSGVVQVNDDLSPAIQAALVSQLFISETILASEFDARVAATPEYPLIIKQNNIRLLVVRSFYDFTNRNLADLVIFCKNGQCAIESCKIGPPKVSFPISRLSYKELLQCFPDFDGYCCNNNTAIQDNILFPLVCRTCGFSAFPFGEDCWRAWQLEANPYHLIIYCRCPGGPYQWL